jgi:feruloyl-CoA synthase
MSEPEARGPEEVRAALSRLLAVFNARPGGSSNRILRLLVLDEPPSAAAGEVTDKRSLNSRRVLERRAADVARLYAEPVDPAVIY